MKAAWQAVIDVVQADPINVKRGWRLSEFNNWEILQYAGWELAELIRFGGSHVRT